MKSRTLAWASTVALALTTALTVVPAAPASASSDVGTYIVGGSDATEDYPFAARTLSHYPGIGTARCTATLVTVHGRIGVATAAHCVSDLVTGAAIPATNIEVQIGSTRLDELTTVGVKRVEVNPEWDWATGPDRVADVAVLVLDTDLPLTGIRLGNQVSDHRKVRILGWGKTTVDATVPPPVLQQLDTRLTTPDKCASAGITEGELCVNDADGATACQGDSGGPALGRTPNNTWVLLGGTSRVTDEQQCAGPAVYTNFVFWSDWITEALTRGLPHKPRHVEHGAAQRFYALAG
ncbi:MAG: serine protease [Actinoplanes sp.]